MLIVINVAGPDDGDDHVYAGGGQRAVQRGGEHPQDLLLQDDRLLPDLQPQHHHPRHGLPHLHDRTHRRGLRSQPGRHGDGEGNCRTLFIGTFCLSVSSR